MSIYEHLSEFAGKEVIDYEPGLTIDPQSQVYRIRVDYDSEHEAVDLLTNLLSQDAAEQLEGLIIGMWASEMYDNPPTALVETLVAAAPRLPQLRALFLGEMISEENEISWIYQTDISPIWAAFPRLEELRIRGSQGLSLGQSPAHANLRTLAIECGGLPRSVLAELNQADFPHLESLELYLGTDNYGWDGSVADLETILSGKLFPKLKYLGLRDSEIADEVAAAVAQSPVLERIEVLDLSLGTLGDVGGEALLNSPAVAKLKRLDLSHHYLSEEMQQRLAALSIEVVMEDEQTPDDWGDGELHRYVAVSE